MKEKDWFEKKVGIRLYKRVENVVNNGHLADVWEIRWDNHRCWEITDPDDSFHARKTLPSVVQPLSQLRKTVWDRIKEKLDDGWVYSYDELPKLKPYYFVEDGKGDNDDLIYVIHSSEEGSKDVVAMFSVYFPESRELAESVCKSLNDKLKPHAEFSLNVYTPIRTDCDSYTGNTSL